MKKILLVFLLAILFLNVSLTLTAGNNIYHTGEDAVLFYINSNAEQITTEYLKEKIKNNLRVYAIKNFEYPEIDNININEFIAKKIDNNSSPRSHKFFIAFEVTKEKDDFYKYKFFVTNFISDKDKQEIISYVGSINDLDLVINCFSNFVVQRLKGFEGAFSDEIIYISKSKGISTVALKGFKENEKNILFKGSLNKHPYQVNIGRNSNIVWAVEELNNGGKNNYSLYINKIQNYLSESIYISPTFDINGTLVVAHSDALNTVLYKFVNGVAQKITNGSEKHLIEISPTFSGDEKFMVFVKALEGTKPHLYVKDLLTGKEEILLESKYFQTDPSFSKKQNVITFINDEKEIHRLELYKKESEKIVSGEFINRNPSFSNDDALILFSSNRNGSFKLFSKFVNNKGIFNVLEEEEILVFDDEKDAQSLAVFGTEKTNRYKKVYENLKSE